jgi:hypothetical protein
LVAPLGTEALLPVFVTVPEASGVPAVGRTWMFEKIT